MAPISTYASALLLLSSCLAEAIPTRFNKRTFSIKETPVKRSLSSGENPYRKRDIRRRNNKDGEESSAVATSISGDIEYLLPVKIGNGTFNMQLDTGSSDLWVFSENNKRAGKHPRYKPSKNGKKIPHSVWDIAYAEQSGAYGEVWTDTVSIDGLSYRNQGVEVATYATDSLLDDKDNDGIIGFGFSSANHATPKQKTFFENIVDQLEEPLFTATLKHDSPGTYDFGFIDKEKYTGDITYVDVNPANGYWGFTVDGFWSGNTTIAKNMSGLADTGTTLISLDDASAKQYLADVKGVRDDNDSWTVDCDAKLPDLTFKISGHTVKIPGNSQIPTGEGKNQCYASAQGGGGDSTIMGDVFLKTQFVVFKLNDGEHNAQLGFAAQAA